MIGTKIIVTGDKDLRRKFAQMTASAQGMALSLAAQAGGEAIRSEASQRAPYLSGTLRRSIHTVVVRKGMRADCTIGTNLVYAAIQEFGGVISAKRARMLAFQIDGEWVFAKQVTIPAHPYLRPAFDYKVGEAIIQVGAVFKELVIGPVVAS